MTTVRSGQDLPVGDELIAAADGQDELHRAAAAAVMARVPSDAWLDNPEAGTWGVLDAIFGDVRTTAQTAALRTSKTYADPNLGARITAAGNRIPAGESPPAVAYRARIREWAEAEGLLSNPKGPINPSLLDRYVATTGDRWTPVDDAGATADAT